VVTANKEVIAKEWDALHEAARLGHRELRFEAAVGGAVPVVRGVMELGAIRPRVLRGLLNGTTTYICSRLESGVSFGDALKEAQAKGYAEPDPTNDVDGFDAAYKLSILVSLLEGRHFRPDQVRRTSLSSTTAAAAAAAAARGARIRYLAVADFGDKATKCRVGPEEVPADSLEGRATGPTNVITLESDMAATLVWSGPGAGGDATASAILADVIAIARVMRLSKPIVFKFGGTSVASPPAIEAVAKIVAAEQGQRMVVVSATAGHDRRAGEGRRAGGGR